MVCRKLCGDVADTPSDAENTDTNELPQAAGVSGSDGQAEQSSVATDPGADTLMGIEHFYAASDNVGPEIDAQLAKIVSGFVTTRLPDDKLKEKLTACLAPKNCADIVSPRVNPEIWEKLSTQTKSLDVKTQRTQNALVGAIAEIAVTANTLVRSSRSGDPLSGPEMGTALTSLVDVLALLGNVNLDMNHGVMSSIRNGFQPTRRYKQRLQRPVQGWCRRIGPPLRRQPVDAH